MRGAPFLQTILIVAAFLLAGVPTYRLTQPAAPAVAVANTDRPGASPTADHSPSAGAPLNVDAIFAPAPAEFQITNLGRTVLAGHGPQTRFAGPWTADMPPEGVDLVVHARWPAESGDAPRAMRITVRFPGGRSFDKTVWAAANGELEEVLTVPGEAVAAP